MIAAARAVALGDASSGDRRRRGVDEPGALGAAQTGEGFPTGTETLHSTALGWRMVNPRMPAEWTVSLGECTELLAERYGISREAQDEFALRSHRAAAAAWDRGVYDDEVVPLDGTISTATSASGPTPPPRRSPS